MTNQEEAPQTAQDPGADRHVHEGQVLKGKRGAVADVAPDQGLLAPMKPVIDPLPSQRPAQPSQGSQGHQSPATGDNGRENR